MSLELIIVAALLVIGVLPLAMHLRSALGWVAILLVAGAGMTAAWWWQSRLIQQEKKFALVRQKAPREERTGGYAGSSSCRSCHPGPYASWHDSFHRTMTQYPNASNVRGNFNDVRLEFAGDTYHLQKDAQGYWVEMVDPDWKYTQLAREAAAREGRPISGAPIPPTPPRVRRPITLMTGSHHMQTYWVASASGNLQFNLPFTYLFEAQRWAPRHDVFLLNPDKHYSMQLWNMVCINCHATAGQPRQNPGTKIVDSQTAELGISCEACHGPGEAHVRANASLPRRYELHARRQTDPTIFNPQRVDHVKASETCGQCHAIRRKLDPQAWLAGGVQFVPGGDVEKAAPLVRWEDPHAPGTPERKRVTMEGSFWKDGQVRVSGRDFNGLAASPCYQRGALSCLSCHSMHSYESTTHQLAPNMESNDACLQCHQSLATRLEAHTHHRAGSSGSLCYNCHMPYTSYGLLKAIRSHTITSPTAQETLATGRPNACNLCHLDRTLGWTAATLNAWTGRPIPAMPAEQTNIASSVLLILQGDAGQRALLSWHAGWTPAREISGDDWMAPYLAELLTDSYSVVRFIAQRSLQRQPAYAGVRYDYIGPATDRERARQEILQIWRARSGATAGQASPATLVQPDGRLDEPRYRSLRALRNDPPMELLE